MSEPECVGALQAATSSPETNERRFRHLLGKTALCIGSIALGAGIGASVGLNRPTHTTLAGNDATAELQVGNSDVDLGIIGAHIPSKTSLIGLPIGATVRLDASKSYAPKKSANDKILPELLQTFNDLNYESGKINSDISWHIARDSRNGALGGLVAAGGFLFIAGAGKRAWHDMEETSRQDFKQNFGPLWKKARNTIGAGSALLAATACGVAGVSYAAASANNKTITPNPAFADTPLEGSEIVGLVAPLVDTVVPLIKTYVTDTDTYYNQIDKNFEAASAKYRESNVLPTNKNIVPILLVSDRHCNVGMDRVLSSAAKTFKAQIIASGGDDNFWGSFPFEAACTAGLADRAKGLHMNFIQALGNHDQHDKTNPALTQGIKVVDGSSVSVNTSHGTVTFLSTHDPRRSQFERDITPSSSEAQSEAVVNQGIALGKLACDNPKPTDILITHDTRAATMAIENGCGTIGFAFSGHTHHRQLPWLTGNTYQYTEGSTGGAAPEEPSIGPLGADATFSLLYFNSETHTPESMIYFTVHKNKRVEISTISPFTNGPSNYNTAANT